MQAEKTIQLLSSSDGTLSPETKLMVELPQILKFSNSFESSRNVFLTGHQSFFCACPHDFSVALVFPHQSYNVKDSLSVALQDANCLKLTVRERMGLHSFRLWCGCLKWGAASSRKASCFLVTRRLVIKVSLGWMLWSVYSACCLIANTLLLARSQRRSNKPFRNCAGNWDEFQILTNR